MEALKYLLVLLALVGFTGFGVGCEAFEEAGDGAEEVGEEIDEEI